MYYLLYGFFWLLSLIPLRALYLLSDFFYLLIFYLFKYRKKVVMQNLQQAFPEKTEKERTAIAKKFYRNLADSFAETIKIFSSGKNFFNKHCTGDYTLFDKYNLENKTCQVHPCHHFNWEWVNQHFSLNMKQPMVAVYMPLTSKPFEELFYRQRTKLGSIMLPATDMRNSFLPWRNKLHVLALVADQNPGHPGNAYWFNFLNKPAPFVRGPEKSARDKKCPVIFAFIIKRKRGYYHINFVLAAEDVSLLKEGELTAMYVDQLTANIKEFPENWLWSHRRWKHEWKAEYGPVIK